MKSENIIIIIMTFIIVVMFSLTYQMSNRGDKYRETIKAYKEYYSSTETLIDSLGIYCDHPVMETDAGTNYLIGKSRVDRLDK